LGGNCRENRYFEACGRSGVWGLVDYFGYNQDGSVFQMLRALISLVVIVASVWCLQAARQGVEISTLSVGQTPVVHYARPRADGVV
jgi:hypothetical protein